jgi:DNA-directed RNA polymerases I, II, and III subunit RPABC2
VVKYSSDQKTPSKKHKTKGPKRVGLGSKKSHTRSGMSTGKKKIASGKGTKPQIARLQVEEVPLKTSGRPVDEVVTYTEMEFKPREITTTGNIVLIGPPRITRFEKARITGARSLQLSLGAPAFMKVSEDVKDSISLATAELEARTLPISIRRVLPNGVYQDIPIEWMK